MFMIMYRIDSCMAKDHTCEICERGFESYMLLVKDNFVEILEWQKRKKNFEHLCEWCNYMYFQQDWHEKRQLAEQYGNGLLWGSVDENAAHS